MPVNRASRSSCRSLRVVEARLPVGATGKNLRSIFEIFPFRRDFDQETVRTPLRDDQSRGVWRNFSAFERLQQRGNARGIRATTNSYRSSVLQHDRAASPAA